MNFYQENDVFDFFDVSIILPFYKKLNEFRSVLPRNLKYFQRNGIELIIVLDEPSEEKKLIDYLDEFPFLNSKVIINRQFHEWRNPSKALNVGIRNAHRKFVFVASPETEFLTDVIYQLRYLLHYHPNSYAIGQVTFLDFLSLPQIENICDYPLLPYGSIMVERKYLEEVNGYSEKLTYWGGDDDNIRARLDLLGLKRLLVEDAIGIHREENAIGHDSRFKRGAQMPIETYKEIYYPQKTLTNDNSWGTEFKDVAYEWKHRKSKQKQCENYLSNYTRSWIRGDTIFNQCFKIIALIQTKNEIRHITEVLEHLDNYCDGIILLDDNSTDGTYEKAQSNKLLLKVQKEPCEVFDDLNLRNITLRLGAFFNSDWLFF